MKPLQPTELAELVERYVLARIALERAVIGEPTPGWYDACVAAAEAATVVRNQLEAVLGVGSELTAAYTRTLRLNVT